MRVAFYDWLVFLAEQMADRLSSPFARIERWAADRYFEARNDAR